jgi:hypothetical protein
MAKYRFRVSFGEGEPVTYIADIPTEDCSRFVADKMVRDRLETWAHGLLVTNWEKVEEPAEVMPNDRILAYLDERIECLKEMLGKLEGFNRGAAIDITYMRGKRDELQRMKLAIERGTLEANKDV